MSPDAIEVTKANLANHDTLDARVLLSTGSWFDALPPEMLRKFDIVISNPPYIGNDEDLDTEISDWEPCIALRAGPLGTENINHLIKEASNWLTGDGSLILELPPHFAKQAKNLAQTSGYFNVRIHHDLTGRERILVARRSA